MGRPDDTIDFNIIETFNGLLHHTGEPGKRAVQEALMPDSIGALKMLRKASWKEWQTHYVENWVGKILGERQ